MSWAAIVVGGVSLGYSIYNSEHKKNQARKLEAKNKKPDYKVQQPIIENQTLAENMAQQGLSDSSKQIATDNLNEGFNSSINALLEAGGGLNSISDLYSSFGDNLKGLAGLDNEVKYKNQQLLMGQNERMGQEFDKQFQLGSWFDYVNKAQRIAELRGQAKTDRRDAESEAVGIVSSAALGFSSREPKEKKKKDSLDIDPNDYDAADNINTEKKRNYLLDDLYSENSAWV